MSLLDKVRYDRVTAAVKAMREDILNMSLRCGTMGAHLGGSMSAVEIMAVLYLEFMNNSTENSNKDTRDRFIMSKAHSSMVLYAALHQIGMLTDEEIANAMINNDILFKHPKMNVPKGIEFSGGSLGQGLSLGVGTALALKLKGLAEPKVYVMLGDGECDEGSVYEAAVSAAHYQLDNLVVIVDCNKLQNDGTTHQIMDKNNIAERWKVFGYSVIEVDGHDIEQLYDAFSKKVKGPVAIIANTVKGKGVSFAENIIDWHAGYLTKELYDKAMLELRSE